jgi:hypothetical protein
VQLGVFIPIGTTDGWLISTTSPQYLPVSISPAAPDICSRAISGSSRTSRRDSTPVSSSRGWPVRGSVNPDAGGLAFRSQCSPPARDSEWAYGSCRSAFAEVPRPRSSFHSIAAFIVMACQMASYLSSVSGRRVGSCGRIFSRFLASSENSMLNVKEVSKCSWENEGIYSNLNKFD